MPGSCHGFYDQYSVRIPWIEFLRRTRGCAGRRYWKTSFFARRSPTSITSAFQSASYMRAARLRTDTRHRAENKSHAAPDRELVSAAAVLAKGLVSVIDGGGIRPQRAQALDLLDTPAGRSETSCADVNKRDAVERCGMAGYVNLAVDRSRPNRDRVLGSET